MLGVLGIRRSREETTVIAIGDHSPADGSSGQPFRKGERFILKSTDLSTNWWQVKNQDGVKFFAPSNFLVKESDFVNTEWISFDVDRGKAEAVLKNTKFGHASFVIRSTATNYYCKDVPLALSIKTNKSSCPEPYSVIHYVISRKDNGFRMGNEGRCFDSLTHLVEHYAGRRNESNITLVFSVKKDEIVTPWEYSASAIKKGNRLDGGTFGEVFLGTLFGKETVAIKTPKPPMDAEDFIKEALIARNCKHPNVLETIGICNEIKYIITEYMANGSLKKYLGKHQLNADQCLSVALKIASGMEYLTSIKKIVHRDLAARNILVGETIEDIKVADYGLARSLEESKYYITQRECFPRRWTAPEGFVNYDGILVKKTGEITSAADVWSYGVVLWELYSNGQEPYRTPSKTIADIEKDLYDFLTAKGERLERTANCPENIYALMLKCWNIDRKARPTFADIHAFLSELISANPAAPAAIAAAAVDRITNSDTEDEAAADDDGVAYNMVKEPPADERDESPLKTSQGDSPAEKPVESSRLVRLERVPIAVSSSGADGDDGEPDRPTFFSLG